MIDTYLDEPVDCQEETDEKAEETSQITCALSYKLIDSTGELVESGEALGQVYSECISIVPKLGTLLSILFREMEEIIKDNYKLHIILTSNEKITISDLGYSFDSFMRTLCRMRNELIMKDMLMDEKLIKSQVYGEYSRLNENNECIEGGNCETRLYETSIVIVPEAGYPVRIPYSVISEVFDENYRIKVSIKDNHTIILSMLGREFEPLRKALAEAMNNLSTKVQSHLKELFSGCDQSALRKAARIMKDGKAAKKKELDIISPKLWANLETKIQASNMREEYDFLKSLGHSDSMSIGIKRGLLDNLTGEYIWFISPILISNNKDMGNAIAVESCSEDNSGKAKYFFRIVSRDKYSSYNIEDLSFEADNFI